MPTATTRKPLFGSVESRGNSFRAVWRVEGRKETKTFDTYDEACDFLDAMAIEVRNGRGPTSLSKPRTLFKDAAELWLAAEAKDIPKKRSVLNAQLIPAFGERPVGDLTRREVQQWVNRLSEDLSADCDMCEEVQSALGEESARCRQHKGTKAGKPSSVHTYYQILGKMLSTLQLDGYLPGGCPVGKGLITLPSLDKRMVILDESEVNHLLRTCHRLHPTSLAFVHLAVHTGLRIGELVALDRSAHRDGSLMVSKARKADGRIGTTKTNRVRQVDLSECCIELLDAQLAGHSSEFIFPGPQGGMNVPENWRKRVWHALVREAGFADRNLHFHDLRHTHCSRLLSIGWPVLEVAERLGHKSAKMTLDVYGHTIRGSQGRLLRERGI